MAVLAGPLFVFAFSAQAGEDIDVQINEVQVYGKDSSNDFVELYNFGDNDVSLDGMELCKIASTGTWSHIANTFSKDARIGAGKYYVWANSKNDFDEEVDADVSSATTIADKNAVVLYDGSCSEKEKDEDRIIDTVKIQDAPKENSFSRRADKGDWSWTPIVTPGKKNDFPEAAKDAHVRLNEILPNPEGDELGEFIELYNAGSKDVDLRFWSVADKSKAYLFSEKAIIEAGGYLVLGKETFKFSLNNSNEKITLFDPVGNVVDSVSYKTSKEGVSLGRYGEKWRACKKLTPGKENVFNAEPKTKSASVPKKAYKDVYVEFSVKTKDKDKDTVKVRWDFGDGHKSYLAETRHKYEKTGKYTVVLRLDDGKDAVEKTYHVKVEKYPKKKVEVIGMMPNPKGKDAEGEFLILKSNEKKEVDLEGWSVASGSKKSKLANHPIRESFKIGGGQEKQITREESKFLLGNKTLYLELRYPDGRVAQKVHFSREKSVGEDDMYMKRDGVWVWETPQSFTEDDAVKTPLAKAEKIVDIAENAVGDMSIGQFTISKVLQVFAWDDAPQVLGARTHRLERRGARYVFTRAVSEPHYAKAWVKKVGLALQK